MRLVASHARRDRTMRVASPRVRALRSVPTRPERGVRARGRAAAASRVDGSRGRAASDGWIEFARARARDAVDGAFGVTCAVTCAVVIGLSAPDAGAIEFQRLDASQVDYLRRRDEAASFKCKGGMFDCDGDRREYARQQTERLYARQRTADPSDENKDSDVPCTIEDPCTDNVLRAALSGVQGLTTSEKLEKMGKPTDAVNSTSRYFDF